jgi:amino acid adenylation domain-containing protein/thioester reductase-like protein
MHLYDIDPNQPNSPKTLVDLLCWRSVRNGAQTVYGYLSEGELPPSQVTYAQLDQQARAIAVQLQARFSPGERVMLLYKPGLEFIAAYFGCLYAGMVAVPSTPPRTNKVSARLQGLSADSGAVAALTQADILANIQARFDMLPELANLFWLNTEAVHLPDADLWCPPAITADSLAFIQYTSGSTSQPKGVLVSHANLMHNLYAIRQGFRMNPNGMGVFWLPSYHDMGLIGGILEPMYIGGSSYLMAPATFLHHPSRWLSAISQLGGTISGAPNFAFQLCAEKVTPSEREKIDLSKLEILFCGSEPIRAETLRNFASTFAECGFRESAFYPCYGMAETTLIATGYEGAQNLRTLKVERTALANNRFELATADTPAGQLQELVSSGTPCVGMDLRIVDPHTHQELADGNVGEIWIAGDSVAQGYWQNESGTTATFRAFTHTGLGPFLRSGDLGFLVANGHATKDLFVTGRVKDLIIIRGRNLYPQDIEHTVGNAHPALQLGMSAAFGVEIDGAEQLVVVQEVSRHSRRLNLAELAEAVRRAVAVEHGVQLAELVLIKPLSVPRTSSGKIQRFAAKQGYLQGTLAEVGRWSAFAEQTTLAGQTPAPAPINLSLPSTPAIYTPSPLEQFIAERIAATLKLPVSRIDRHEPFANFGLDSVQTVNLSAELEKHLGQKLSATLLWDFPTIAELATHLAGTRSVQSPSPLASGPAPTLAEPIAVIGMACRFPGAPNLAEFWRILAGGESAIVEVPTERWENLQDEAVQARLVSNKAGLIADVAQFDAAFFGISPREATRMDPQQRILLETTWHALENAGLAPNLQGQTPLVGGVFMGVSSYDYSRLQFADAQNVDAYAGTGNAHSIVANRLSYLLDFRGPSVAVDTACSSSLVAVHLAMQSLRTGECELAVAGGVNLLLSPELSLAFSHARMLSPTGACKTFSAQADGYVRGEGCGVVVLKRLSAAERDGNRILAVLRGSAVNQDGRSNGLTAPNRHAQSAVIRQALQAAQIQPAQIGYIEAHGTGTPLGDPIEISALQDVFDGQGDTPLWVGSVKTNIGHLEAAAGIAGLLKGVLALQNGQLPTHRNFTQLNPHIHLHQSRIRIASPAFAALPAEMPSRMGVSSFGFGGTNAHVILEKYATPNGATSPAPVQNPYLLTISGRTEGALHANIGQFLHLINGFPTKISDIAYSAQLERSAWEHRLAVVVESAEQVQAALQANLAGAPAEKLRTGKKGNTSPNIAFVFSGQGAQTLGMGRELYQNQPIFRGVIERCAQWIQAHAGWDLLAVLGYTASENAPDLHQTAYTQPALFAFEVALASLWQSWGIRPSMVLGHSVGEISAAYLAGVFDLPAALQLVVWRANAMQALGGQGGMAAVSAGLAQLQPVLAQFPTLEIAALNSPKNTTISAPLVDIQAFLAACTEHKLDAQLLKTSHAFHSAQMEPMLAEFAARIASLPSQAPRIPLVSNLSGQVWQNAPQPADWAAHVRQPVQFAAGVQSLWAHGVDMVLEIGPHSTLLGLVRQNLHSGQKVSLLASLLRNQNEQQCLLDSLAQLWLAGAVVDWRGFWQNAVSAGQVRAVPLPNYPFQHQRFWFQPSNQRTANLAAGSSYPGTRLPTAVPIWQAQFDPTLIPDLLALLQTGLLACAQQAWGDAVRQVAVVVDVLPTASVSLRWQTVLENDTARVYVAGATSTDWRLLATGAFLTSLATPVPAASLTTEEISSPPAQSPNQSDVLDYLRPKTAGLLALPVQDLPIDRPLGTLGVDSLMAMELRAGLEARFQRAVPLVWLMEGLSLAQLAERLENHTPPATLPALLADTPTAEPFPLSANQQAMWFLSELLPRDVSFNVAGACRVQGTLDAQRLSAALAQVLARHPMLSARFQTVRGLPMQWTAEPNHGAFSVTRLPAQADLMAELQSLAHAPFDLAAGQLVRLVLLEQGADQMILLAVHHIVTDFWSMSVLVTEILQAYQAGTLALPPVRHNYADFVRWQNDYLASPTGEQARAYWHTHLHGDLPLLDLPTDFPRPALQTFRGDNLTHLFPTDLADRLRALAQAQGVTLYTLLLSAFQTLLYRYTAQDDLLVGSVLNGREQPELAGVVGYFVNPLAFRADFSANPSFVELLAQQKQNVLNAFAHQHYPLPLLAESLQAKRSADRPPLFETLFIFQQAQRLGDFDSAALSAFALGLPTSRLQVGELSLQPLAMGGLPAQFDLTLMLAEVPEGLGVNLHYNTALFRAETMTRWVAQLGTLLAGICDDPHTAVRALPLLPATERETLLQGWNQTELAYPHTSNLADLLYASATQHAERTALKFSLTGESLCYAELDARANQLAHHLQVLGVSRNVPVGLCLPRTADLLVAVLAVLKAGGCYVPLDPAFPEQRLAWMLADADPLVVVSHRSLADVLPALGCELLWLDEDQADIAEQPTSPPDCPATAEDLAYILYTSGSTGKPKGVELPRRAVVNFLESMRHQPGLHADDCMLAVTTLSFDIAVLELLLPLWVGACVELCPRDVAIDGLELQNLLATSGATAMQATPATWQMLVESGWRGQPHLKALCGGEALPRKLAQGLLGRVAELWNLYGPTETCIWSTVCPVTRADLYGKNSQSVSTVSIGRPIANTQIYLLTETLQPVPTGAVGRLYIGGDGVAHGYHNRPDLTAERFLDNPFRAGGRMYHTGDLARYLPDGRLLFLGRSDHQVKVNGFRIELGEIESTLTRHPDIAQAVVLPMPQDGRLVASVVLRAGAVAPALGEVRGWLSQHLPAYMLPAVLNILPTFPLTPNGKIDRKALPTASAESALKVEKSHVPPRTPLEVQLCELAQGALGVNGLGVTDNFFEWGANSLMATKLAYQVRQTLGVQVPLRTLFANPSVAGLAQAIQALQSAARTDSAKKPLFADVSLADLLASAKLPADLQPNLQDASLSAQPYFLLTGATGFVGAFLLADLLRQTAARVACLVRANSAEQGLTRLQANLQKYGVWQAGFAERIDVLCGDLGLAGLGLSAEQRERLANELTAIYHNGALVNFVYTYEQHRASNVGGTLEILRLAARRNLPVHLVSTLSVFHTGSSDHGNTHREDDDLRQVGVPFGGYAQSKWVAEQMAFAAQARGFRVTVYRPGLVSGHSQSGAWNSGDMMTAMARACLLMGAVPDLDIQVDLVPVDFVSRAIVALSLRSNPAPVYHLANPQPLAYRALVAWLGDTAQSLEVLPFDRWRTRLTDLLLQVGGNDALAYLPLIEEVEVAQVYMPSFDCTNTRRDLQGCGVACPAVDGALLDVYLASVTGGG